MNKKITCYFCENEIIYDKSKPAFCVCELNHIFHLTCYEKMNKISIDDLVKRASKVEIRY